MSLPRRDKILIGLFVPLLLVGVGYNVYLWRVKQKRAAHWQGIIDRQVEYDRVNGPAGKPDSRLTGQSAPSP